MQALRVFAIQYNSIQDLPPGLGRIATLKLLKLIGNPLNAQLRTLVQSSDDSMSPPTPGIPNDDNMKDRVVTQKVTEFLRSQSAIKESGEESSDGPLETPRAQSRFPVQAFKYGHNASGSESASDTRSPGLMKSNVPSRSHFRGPSFQNGNSQAVSALHRPGLAPLTLGNERNRSNSESLLQSAQQNKNKRMGIVPKRQAGLGVLDENRANRSSYHLRGQSHGSALKNGFRPGESSDSDIAGPSAYQQGTFVRRLSSIPEQKQNIVSTDEIIEGAKGILFSLHLVHPQILTLMTLVKDSNNKRSSLHRVYRDASIHLDNLDHEIHRFDNTQRRGKRVVLSMKKSICRASHACIAAYQQVGGIILSNVAQIVKDGDQRYIRMLMLMLYGTLNEARNARNSLISSNHGNQAIAPPVSARSAPTIKRVAQDDTLRNRAESITPTKGRPKPEKPFRVPGIGQQPFPTSITGHLPSHTGVQSYVNGRSRSNSRAGGLYTSTSSSVASTPRSAESFSSGVLGPRSRSGSVARNPERAYQAQVERDQFERIFLTLSKAADQGLQVIPHLEPRFISRLEGSKRTYTAPQIKDLWVNLVARTRLCMEMSEALKSRLSAVKLNDPEARNASDFWRLATKFVKAYGNLLVSLREARLHQLVDNEIRNMLRPVHKSTIEATNLINESPWNRLTSGTNESGSDVPSQPQSTIHSRAPTPVMQNSHLPSLHIPLPHPPPPTPVAMQPPSRSQSQSRGDPGFHRRAAENKGSNGSNNGVVSPASSYSASVPATPLSAALGPAAQATVSSALNKSFEGDVFQRADYLQSTMRRVG